MPIFNFDYCLSFSLTTAIFNFDNCPSSEPKIRTWSLLSQLAKLKIHQHRAVAGVGIFSVLVESVIKSEKREGKEKKEEGEKKRREKKRKREEREKEIVVSTEVGMFGPIGLDWLSVLSV